MQLWKKPLPVLLISSLTATAAAMSPGGGEPAVPAAGLTDQTPEAGSTDETVIHAYFKNGLRFETANKSFTFKLGARIAFDTDFMNVNTDYENAYGLEEDGSRFRFARVSGEGTFNENTEFKWSYDFNGGVNNRLKDVYIGFTNLSCGGGLRIGQFKEPMGLEQLTSAANSTFLERGASDALVPGRNIGVMYYNNCSDARMAFAGGIFRDDGSDTGADTGDHGDYIFTGRVAHTPMMEDASHLLHVGVSARRRQFQQDNFSMSYSGETTVSKQGDLAALDLTSVDHSDTVGLETAWVNGPCSLQAEYVKTVFDRHNDTGVDVEGWYLFGSWFLTGEYRPYESKKGTFGRVHVNEPKGVNGGMGATEFAVRLSRLDLNTHEAVAFNPGPGNGLSDGGRVDSFTAGFNWYLNDHTRIMTNYIRMYPDDGTSGSPVADIVQIRVQIDV